MKKSTKIIGKNKYELLTPPVRKAMPVCTKIAVLLGPTLASLGKQLKPSDGSSTTAALDIFASSVSGIDADKLDELFMKAVDISGVCCNGASVNQPIDFERHFGEYRSDTYMICVWALWECVKDFFPQLHGLIPKVKSAVEKAVSESQMDGQETGG